MTFISQREAERTLTTKYCKNKEIQRDVDVRKLKRNMVIPTKKELFELTGFHYSSNNQTNKKIFNKILKHVELEELQSRGYKIIKCKTKYEPNHNFWHSQPFDDPRFMMEQVILYAMYNYGFNYNNVVESFKAFGILPDSFFEIKSWECFDKFYEYDINPELYKRFIDKYFSTVKNFIFKVITNMKKKGICTCQRYPCIGEDQNKSMILLTPEYDNQQYNLYQEAHEEVKQKLHTHSKYNSYVYIPTLNKTLNEKNFKYTVLYESISYEPLLDKKPQLINEFTYLLYRKKLIDFFIKETKDSIPVYSDFYNDLIKIYDNRINHYSEQLNNKHQKFLNSTITQGYKSSIHTFSHTLSLSLYMYKIEKKKLILHYEDELNHVITLFLKGWD